MEFPKYLWRVIIFPELLHSTSKWWDIVKYVYLRRTKTPIKIVFKITFVQIRFLKNPYFGQQNEHGGMVVQLVADAFTYNSMAGTIFQT